MFDINEFNENLDFRRMIEGERNFVRKYRNQVSRYRSL